MIFVNSASPSKAGGGTAAVEPGAFEDSAPLPLLPFEGLLPAATVPEQQAPFIHWTVNQAETRSLLLLPHHGDPHSPVQCGLVDALTEDPLTL
jgi:hypothetical protein